MSASKDMVIILTGASRGIGLAIARHLLTTSPSTKLVLTARTTTSLTALADQHGADRVEVLAGDAADTALAPKLVARALERWGRLDALIVNHGALDPVKKVADSSPAEWRDAFDINVFSAVGLVCRLLFPMLHAAHVHV
jgi:NADP-dependent 3-hydroxy acid dehydrogenase YdfG